MKTLENRIILITGATDGLGKKLSLDLAARGAELVLHGRSPEKEKAAAREIRDATGNSKLACYNADFSSLAAVRDFSENIRADCKQVDVLINNAGIGPGSSKVQRELSKDGHELRFAVNYLAHFLLTHRLLPLLGRSGSARIVNVASGAQQAIDFDNVILKRGYDGRRAYSQSKLAMVMFTFDLAEDLRESAIAVNCLHPATLMPTNMVLDTDYFKTTVDSVGKGADAVEYLAVSPEIEGVSGKYFEGRQRAKAHAQAYDSQARQKLRTLSNQLTE
ncbi:MAG: SDR family NAD(P)-dependent oxidoreductase [Desulfobacterales bacterium]|nr:SDR family NAD(P)-dependent oxidoreductase [Desulfobacterales bacterium]